MSKLPVLLVQGAADASAVPGLASLQGRAELRFATQLDELRAALPGAEILLGWKFNEAGLVAAWDCVDGLRWAHWGGAGVDAVLFSELVESDVILTNSRGVFDRAMAEYVLGAIIAFAKHMPESLRLQQARTWRHRLTERIQGKRVIIVGVGSIGRETARLLAAAGLQVSGVGTRARVDDADFGEVHAASSLVELLPEADYVVLVTPLTDTTKGMFGARELDAMKSSARLINVGRGAVVDEPALIAALESGHIAGAALDVFVEEPLPASSPLWKMPHVIVSPHMCGDFYEYPAALAEIFLDNFERYCAGQALRNVVDKRLGYVTE